MVCPEPYLYSNCSTLRLKLNKNLLGRWNVILKLLIVAAESKSFRVICLIFNWLTVNLLKLRNQMNLSFEHWFFSTFIKQINRFSSIFGSLSYNFNAQIIFSFCRHYVAKKNKLLLKSVHFFCFEIL